MSGQTMGTTSSDEHTLDLPGSPPADPPWGVRPVGDNPELAARIDREPVATDEVAIVLGAGGAFGPDMLRALQLRGTGAIVGVDLQVTYPVEGICYRRVNLADPAELRTFFSSLEDALEAAGMRLGPIFDLSTIQTSPTQDVDRSQLERGKAALVAVLRELEREVRLFYMSTAEVYGAPKGAPYTEAHATTPFNDYGREKLREERTLLNAHGAPTQHGTLHVVALRNWTISMVERDEAGRIVESRNYNDPLLAVAERLSRIGARVPIVDPSLLANFHLSEEVAEVSLLLGTAPLEAPTWGRAYNCIGQAAAHGDIVDVAYDVFRDSDNSSPWWAPLVRSVLPARLPRRGLVGLGRVLELGGEIAGARDLSARLPFLYRSTHLDSSALQEALGDRLTEPSGSTTEGAVRQLAIGLREGGDDAVNHRRYEHY